MPAPDMPNDFWPEILVMGKYKERELCFALTPQTLTGFEATVNGLRFALWQAAEHKEDTDVARIPF